MTKREVVNFAVLKAACGYHQGHTSKTIALEHGLISEKNKITKKGQRYIWLAFASNNQF